MLLIIAALLAVVFLIYAAPIVPRLLILGAALALGQYLKEQGRPLTETEALKALLALSGLGPQEELAQIIMAYFPLVAANASLRELRLAAWENKRRCLGPVV